MKKRLIYSMIAATSLFAASCTDFDDYNAAYSNGSEEAGQNLWQNIEKRDNLTQFADLLKKTGYDKELQNSRFYTVWAPENGTFNYDSLKAVDSTALVNRFIKNHIANYNYNVSLGNPSQRVHVLNDKSFNMTTGSDGNLFDGKKMEVSNIPSTNGILHTINGCAEYLPNIYEYIFDIADTDSSLAKYFKRYETEYLDESKSIAGPIDSLGRQTYSDSVMVKENVLTVTRPYISSSDFSLNAAIDLEDSIYTMLVPTDDAYGKLYDKIKECYKYNATTKYLEVPATGSSFTEKSVTLRDEYMQDSLARWSIVQNLVYSNGDMYNVWVPEVNEPSPWQTDTIMTTTYNRLSNGPEMLSHTMGQPVRVSNGYVRRVDSIAYKPWDTWNPELYVNVFSSSVRARIATGTVVEESIDNADFNPAVGDYISRYLEVTPTSGTTTAYFYLNGIRSTTYNVYVIFVPANVTLSGEPVEEKRVCYTVNVNYMTSAGTVGTDSRPSLVFENTVDDPTRPASLAKTELLTAEENLGKIDTVMVGEVTFPYAYVNTGVSPYISVKLNYSRFGVKANYSDKLRIGGIILRPKEYDEYLKNNE